MMCCRKVPEHLTRASSKVRPCVVCGSGSHAAALSYLHGCCGGQKVHANCPSWYFLMRA